MATVGPDVMMRETAHLIGSDKVEGTPVRRSNGDKIGTIERVMIEKRSGRVAYAVMTFGGFLGIGARAAVELVGLQGGSRRLRAEPHRRAAARCAG
jgi:hypothetical protein